MMHHASKSTSRVDTDTAGPHALDDLREQLLRQTNEDLESALRDGLASWPRLDDPRANAILAEQFPWMECPDFGRPTGPQRATKSPSRCEGVVKNR